MHYIKQDITAVERGIVVHGVNCQLRMGRGLAVAVKLKWPQVYEQYTRLRPGRHNLGNIQVVKIEPALYVVNMFTQEFYGGDGKRYADPLAVNTAYRKVFYEAKQRDLPVYSPKVAAGLGGLDWEREVVPQIESAVKESGFTGELFICNP